MGARSLKATLATATDTLLSLRSTCDHHAAALAQLETLVASLVFDPQHPLLTAFLRFQDSFDRNVTATLLEWLGRELAQRQDSGSADHSETWLNIARCLKLIQGLLLLHRPSQRLFARTSSLEYLLAVLDMSRPDHPNSPLLSSPKPEPSPVLFPPTPISSPNLASASAPPVLPTTQLALAALDTLLCALVDRPKNMRKFEEIGGLSAIVKVLKDKNVPQAVRIKVVELLYYYLLPEANNPLSPGPPSPDSSFSSLARSTLSTLSSQVLADATNLPTLFASAADFVPQTPVKTRSRSSIRPEAPAPFSPSGRTLASPDLEPTPRPPRIRLSKDSNDADAEDMPPPRRPRPVSFIAPPSLAPAPERTARHSRSRSSVDLASFAATSGTSSSSGSASSSSSRSTAPTSVASSAPSPTPDARPRHIRTEQEKKELLRKVMPNVEALEDRFRAMGIGLS
ncbi:hypothetical protein JCM10296v2_001282 [Rhodotorula toruloides]